jgi:hypothetical protein
MFRPHRTQGLRGETYGVVHKGGATTSNDKSLIYACVGVRVCTQVTHAHGAVDTAGDMHAPWDARVHPKPQPLNMPLKTGTAREITSVAPRAHVLSKDTQALTVAIVCHTVCVAWQVGTDGGGGAAACKTACDTAVVPSSVVHVHQSLMACLTRESTSVVPAGNVVLQMWICPHVGFDAMLCAGCVVA